MIGSKLPKQFCIYPKCASPRELGSRYCSGHPFGDPERGIRKTVEAEIKDTNPKDTAGIAKLPMHLIPGSAKAYLAMAFLEGALKYGKYNWRIAGVRASIYMDAMERHYEKFKNGEWADPLTHVPHLASIMACAAIILDADAIGKLKDDRPPMGKESEVIDALSEEVLYLQRLYEDEHPVQNTIEEPRCPPESQPTPTTNGTTPAPKPKNNGQRVTRRAAIKKRKAT